MPSSVPPPLQTIRDLCAAHHAYRAHTLNLIASENVMSPWVEQAIDPGLGHRYGDYRGTDPTARKYTGNRHITALDLAARDALQKLFQCRHADLRPLSGHVAGVAVLMACCQPGDLVLELDGPGGGHRLARRLLPDRPTSLLNSLEASTFVAIRFPPWLPPRPSPLSAP